MAIQKLEVAQLAGGQVRCDLEYDEETGEFSAVISNNLGEDVVIVEVESLREKGKKFSHQLPPQAMAHAHKLPKNHGLVISYDVVPGQGKMPNLKKSNFIIRVFCVEV